MISSSHLSKLILFFIFLSIVTFKPVFSEDEPSDIWKKKENQKEKSEESKKKDITIESPILSENINKIVNIEVNEPVYIKRVIGKEYDLIEISNSGILYLNNVIQDYPKIDTTNLNVKEWLIPSGEYFVLGDNLSSSSDSRIYGTIDQKNIVGKAWLKIYPFDQIKVLND